MVSMDIEGIALSLKELTLPFPLTKESKPNLGGPHVSFKETFIKSNVKGFGFELGGVPLAYSPPSSTFYV